MRHLLEYKNRQIIPRFLPYRIAASIENYGNNLIVEPNNVDEFSNKVNDWKQNKSNTFASDLIGASITYEKFDNNDAICAANFVLDTNNKPSILLKEMASSFLHPKNNVQFNAEEIEVHFIRMQLKILKQKLKQYPKNPLLWVDSAYYYTILGFDSNAKKCMNIAVDLNKNRFIARSAARFYLHLGEPDHALYILRNTLNSHYDSLLVASEIAISDTYNLFSKRKKDAIKLIKYSKQSSLIMGELQASIATLEFKNGSSKKAKKLLSKALIHPNENIIAQVQWLSPRFNLVVDTSNYILPANYEALARKFYNEENYSEALSSSIQWMNYQPFSSTPASWASYVSSMIIEDYDLTIKIANQGLRASPNDFLLKNNKAYSMAMLDKIEDSQNIIHSINRNDLSEFQLSTLNATKGLISYKLNKIEEGKIYYQNAISSFSKLKEYRSKAIALYCWAKIEVYNDKQNSVSLLREAVSEAEKGRLKEIVVLSENILKNLTQLG